MEQNRLSTNQGFTIKAEWAPRVEAFAERWRQRRTTKAIEADTEF
jgi:hypothetical protein